MVIPKGGKKYGITYDNIYIRTKFKAEYKVWEAINLGMNISIYRLGNITARYSDGKFQENYDKNAFLNIIKMYKENIIKNKYTFNDVKKLVPNVDLGFLNTKTIYKVKDR